MKSNPPQVSPAHSPSFLRVLCVKAFAFTLTTALLASPLLSQQLRVAAAADLTPVLPKLAETYRQQAGIQILPTFGSSATLTDQIRNGAPFDLFLSADTTHPQQLADAGLSTAAPIPYAHGVLVLWARRDSPAQPLNLASLTNPRVQRVAIANPLHAPYGLAAQQFLNNTHTDIATKLVTAENIAQTAQFAESGNAQCGLISLTTANTAHFRAEGTFVLVPPSTYAPIIQSAVVLKSSHDAEQAKTFLIWLTSPATQANLKQLGLDPVK
jgi:molybdate transport system substrate-binding protein